MMWLPMSYYSGKCLADGRGKMSYNIITLDSTGEHQIDLVSASYWNNEDLEKNKAFNVIDLGFDKIEASLKYKHLLDQLECLLANYNIAVKNSNILSVASGTCWVESQWLKNQQFRKLHCIDISRHRIHKLAPFTMEHYGIVGDVDFLHGSVFDLDAKHKSYDIIFLSQAFHHIEEPIRLLRFLKQLLSENGVILIVGEHYYTRLDYHKRAFKHYVKYFINRKGYRSLKQFYPSWQDLFPPDLDKGDIHWSASEYDFIFKKAGFSYYEHDVHESRIFQSFILPMKDNHA